VTEAERYLEEHRDGFAKWLMGQSKEFQAKIAQGWTEQRKHDMRERMKRIKQNEKTRH
jgi:hypothetical protein